MVSFSVTRDQESWIIGKLRRRLLVFLLSFLEEKRSQTNLLSLLRFGVKELLFLSSVKIWYNKLACRFLARCIVWTGVGYPGSSGYTDKPSGRHLISYFQKGLSVSVHCRPIDRGWNILHPAGISTSSIFNKGTSTFREEMISENNFTVFFPDFFVSNHS